MNALTRTCFICVVLASLIDCSLSVGGKSLSYVNDCTNDGDCGPDGACVAHSCVSTRADLGELYLEISVPSSSPVAPATTTLLKASDLGLKLQGSDAAGFIRNADLVVADLVNVTTKFALDPVPSGCDSIAKNGGIVDHTVEFFPAGQPAGIALSSYSGAQAVPRGIYDIYLRPKVPEASCPVPPALFREQSLMGGSAVIQFKSQPPAQLTGHVDVILNVKDPKDAGNVCGSDKNADPSYCCRAKPSTCSHIQLVDNDSGRVISTDATLLPDGKTTSFVLSYWPSSTKDAKPIDPVLVLTPSDALRKQGMPTPFWKLVAIDPDGDHDVALEVSKLTAATAKPILVEASSLSEMGNPVPSTMLLRSRQLLDGEFGGNAVFEATTQTDPDGKFALSLIPGKYDILAIPAAASGFAVTIDTWTFAAGDLGKGRTFQVHGLSLIKATVLTPRGEAAVNIPVLMAPSRGQNDTLLKLQVQSDWLDSLARSATTQTDGLGGFSLDVDPGRVDLSLRPRASSNLPWLARPQIAIPSTKPAKVDLKLLSFTNPVVLVGRVRSSTGNLLAGVSVRAWLGVTQPGSTAAHPTAVRIGEATSDGAGQYRLLLPASVLQ